MYLLAVMIANCATFRSSEVTHTADATAALKRIHYPFADNDEKETPPRAIISDDADLSQEAFQQTSRGVWTKKETLWLSFDFRVPCAYAKEGHRNEWAWFKKTTRAIMKEMRTLAGRGISGVSDLAHFNLTDYRRVQGPYRMDIAEGFDLPDPEDEKPESFWHVAYEVDYA